MRRRYFCRTPFACAAAAGEFKLINLRRKDGQNSNRLLVGDFAGRGKEAERDGIDITSDEFYEKLVTSSEFPTTSQLSFDALSSLFADAKDKGDEVLVIPIASALSGSCEWAVRAAKESGYDKITVYDSKCTTFMLEILVREAVRLRDKTVGEIVSALDELRPRITLLAALDTLEYLKKAAE